MHKSSFLRMQYLVNWYKKYYKPDSGNIKILDVGSWGEGLTYRDIFKGDEYIYKGLDMVEGPNVDIVPKEIYNWDEIKDDTYDLVISGQCFEHIEYPWETTKEIERVLKPSGFCIIIAPNAGHEHKHPTDCYRYFSDGLAALTKWAGLHVHHTSVAGIPSIKVENEWNTKWNDAAVVAQKPPVMEKTVDDPFPYEQRWMQDNCVYRKCRNWRMALNDLKKNHANDKKFILYGAGEFGREFYEVLGAENVYCFCDGNPEKANRTYLGKKVISIQQLEKIHQDYHIIISTSYKAASEISILLDERNIAYNSFWNKEKQY